jgi:hypothetical protein
MNLFFNSDGLHVASIRSSRYIVASSTALAGKTCTTNGPAAPGEQSKECWVLMPKRGARQIEAGKGPSFLNYQKISNKPSWGCE